MPARNAFDFVEKPQVREDSELRARGDQGVLTQKSHDKIKKVMNGIKRLGNKSVINRRM